MVIHGVGIGHQDGAEAGRRQFRDGQGPGPADHHVRPGIGGAHVLDEGSHLGLHAGGCVGLAGLHQGALAGLVAHHGAHLGGQAGQCRGHGLVEGQGAEAAAQYEQAHRPLAAQESQVRGQQAGDALAHRVARVPCACLFGKGSRETLKHPLGHPRQPAVGKARHGVLLMDDQGDIQRRGHQAAGSGGEAPHAQHQPGFQAQHQAQRGPQGDAQAQGCQQPGHNALATQAGHRQRVQLKSRGRHHPRLEPCARAEPLHFLALAAQVLGHRQAGEDMSTRAACHDQDGTLAHAALLVRRTRLPRNAPVSTVSRCTRSSNPTAAQLTSMELPP
jgi:hypothetical protein